MSENTSGLHPCGHAVLTEPYTPPEKKSGLIYIPESVNDRLELVDQTVRVVEVGPEAWKREAQPRAKPGDIVLVTKMAGYMAVGPQDGKRYRLVNDQDIFSRVADGVYA